MPDGFVSLRTFFAKPPVEAETGVVEVAQAESSPQLHLEAISFAREARLARAALADALDAALEDLLRDIAADVLGRELQLEPVAMQSIVSRALERAREYEPVAVRVHPADVELIDIDARIVADDRLRRGDVAIDVKNGTIDASLGVRLAEVLESTA